jgi:hypothetical protein
MDVRLGEPHVRLSETHRGSLHNFKILLTIGIMPNFIPANPHVQPAAPHPSWEARCECGWSGSRDEGFVHAREHRMAVIFREPIRPVPECLTPPHTVREGIARTAAQISTHE